MKRVVFYILISLFFMQGFGQSFVSNGPESGIIHSYDGGTLGGGVNFCDFDKDGWDDLSFCQNGANPQFFRNVNGQLVELNSFFNNTSELKQITWVDYDNDGDRDLFTTSLNAPFRLYRNDGNWIYTEVSTAAGFPLTDYLTYGNSWGDYDRDGDLDVYICNYNGYGMGDPTVANILYKNNGDGTFVDATIEAGVGNGNNYTFMSLWMDYNNDLWPDLMVINDRLESPNALYRNNADGTFTDISVEANMDDMIFSMSDTGDDYDNDGDLDVYITNGTAGNYLKRNNGDGTFTDMASTTGSIINRFCWAAQFIDADNDGWQDLHICSTPHILLTGENQFLKNNNGFFSHYELESGLLGDGGWSRTSAIGDIDNDGYPDLAIGKTDPDFSRLFLNTAHDNNWMKVNLEGTTSNKDGISSWIECYAGGAKYVRYTYCGESYLGQNSSSEFFGMAQNTMADSLIVRWTSGIVDTWYNIPVNQNLHLVEGTSNKVNLSFQGDSQLCPGESLLLTSEGWSGFLWSTDESSNSILVNTNMSVALLATDSWGNQFISDTLFITNNEMPLVEVSATNPTCANASNGEISLSGNFEVPSQSVNWNGNLIQSLTLNGIPSGMYEYEFTDQNGCMSSGIVELNSPPSLIASVDVTDVRCYGDSSGMVEITPSGGSPGYQINWLGNQPDSLAAGNYDAILTDTMGCIQPVSFAISQPEPISAQIVTTQALCYGDSSATMNALLTGGTGTLIADYGTSNPNALSAGEYIFSVIDEHECVAFFDYQISQPDQLELTVFTTPFYQGLIHGTAIYVAYGGTPAYIAECHSTNGISVDPMNLDAGNYVYVISDQNNCQDSVLFTIDFIGEVVNNQEQKCIVYPNPTDDIVQISMPSSADGYNIKIIDLTGKILIENISFSSTKELSLKHLSVGIYYIAVWNNQYAEVHKLIRR